ncbi:MAG: FAD-dependent oxidoreductase [Betaproteobacteria bacterium]|nr:MAG: FAD-dependent oxidoreductase [Betaproteobacteria bacterium]
MGRRVAVVGAGYAGMAAAVSLAERGIPVTVFESGPLPGGRARRVTLQGQTLDNGQHILVGAYEELFRLMRTVGVSSDALLRIPLEVRYAKGFAFRPLWLPAPLGLLAGLLAAKGIPFRERLGALRFMRALRRRGFDMPEDMTVGALLEAHGQAGFVGRYLWAPLCVSALNTPVHRASAKAFLTVLRETLGGPAGASDLLLPRVDLSRLFPEPAAEFVARRGGEVRVRSAIGDLREMKDFDAVIVAVGPHQLKTLLPDLALDYSYQPIYTCYLQYADTVRLPFPMLGLAGGVVQWVFDRGALLGERGRLACVISAQGGHQEMTLEELAERCHGELAAAIPGLATPLWSRAIAEKRATVTCSPGAPRPPVVWNGVFLAGDYTDPLYPPTLEAAVRSGVRAASAVVESLRHEARNFEAVS